MNQNKVWNPASQRYRQKVSNKEAYKHDLLYVSALNIYLDKKKFPTRCLKLEVEQESGLVWYTTGNYYCYKRSPELEKQINVVYDPDNIYITPVQTKKTKPRVDTPTSQNSDSEPDADDTVMNAENPDDTLGPPELIPEPVVPLSPEPPPLPPILQPVIPAIPPAEPPEEIPDPPVLPPDPVVDMGEPRYQLRDLPSFSGDKNEDPKFFLHKFENFLKYINLVVADGEAVENALQHLGTCLYKDAREWFKTHVGPQRPAANRRTKDQYDQLLAQFIQTFHPMGKTKNQLDLSWESLLWNMQTETIHQFVSKLKNLASVLGKTEADQAYRLKESLPPELRKTIMTCSSVDSIVDVINQMQAMNSLGLNPTVPAATSTTLAMPFMAAQSDASNKQVSFHDSLAQQISQQVTDPLLESIHLLTQKFDSCAVSMRLKKRQ